MDATMKTSNDPVEKYFLAWITHDSDLLRTTFEPFAKYIIINKNKVYNGIEEIDKYWIRNRKRQTDLKVKWKVIDSKPFCVLVDFMAVFVDTEDMEQNTICGRITFKISTNNRVAELSEEYTKKTDDIF